MMSLIRNISNFCLIQEEEQLDRDVKKVKKELKQLVLDQIKLFYAQEQLIQKLELEEKGIGVGRGRIWLENERIRLEQESERLERKKKRLEETVQRLLG
jgi:hypothetical protein